MSKSEQSFQTKTFISITICPALISDCQPFLADGQVRDPHGQQLPAATRQPAAVA